MMKNFSFRTRMIYFGAIALISLFFFSLQLYLTATVQVGMGSYVLLTLWSLMTLFGVGGMIYHFSKKKHQA